MNKQEELKKPIVTLNEVYGKDPRNTDVCYPLSTILKAMEEYADQFKKQLKEKEQESIMLEKMCNRAQDHAEQLLKQLTKSNEMNETVIKKLNEAYLPENIECDGDYCMGCWKDVIRQAIRIITEYQNSKK